MARRPPPGKEIKARLRLDPASVKRLEQALATLRKAARAEVIDRALLAGGEVAADYQKRAGPGPGIEVELVSNVGSLTKGSASGLMKKGIGQDARYVAVGPDKAHWYYRFADSGVKAHGVRRRRTRLQKFAAKSKIKKADVRSFATGSARKAGRMKAKMSWQQGGERIFASRVSGFAAKPFVKPSVDDNGEAINAAMSKVLAAEIEKAAKG